LWAGIFTTNKDVIIAAGAYLVIVGPFYAFHGLGLSLYFASQGAGSVGWPVLAGAVRLLITVGGGTIALSAFGMSFAQLPYFVAAGMLVFGLGTAASVYFGAWRKS
jgi:Na+-driven multidrug efflux pump